jgi:acetyl-CoA acetyltransferase
MSLKDEVAIVGVGVTYVEPRDPKGNAEDLSILAAKAALDDAGLARDEVRGMTSDLSGAEPSYFAKQMGIPEVSFSASLSSGAGGGPGTLGLAASAIVGGFADVVLSMVAVAVAPKRPGGTSSATRALPLGDAGPYGSPSGPMPEDAFTQPSAIVLQAQQAAIIAQRYQHQYGLTREQLAAVVTSQCDNAARRGHGKLLGMSEYLAAPMLFDPLSVLDCSPELEGSFAVAVILTTLERARDLRQPSVVLAGAAIGGTTSHSTMLQMPDASFASSGHREVALDLWGMTGLAPDAVDVALLYDDFSPMVIMQLEDYGFCPIGEGGAFVAAGHTRLGAAIPVNTHGGNLSSAYLRGATHVVEAVEQLRGTAANQVPGAEVALVTGAPAAIPMSAAILRSAS